MGRKSRAKSRETPKARGGEPSFWMISTVICLIFLAGFIAKAIYSPMPEFSPATDIRPVSTPRAAGPLENDVSQVASKFKCACGGCGELPLAECVCSMPRGAEEEKGFIRAQLKAGLSVPQVIELVERKYGLRIT